MLAASVSRLRWSYRFRGLGSPDPGLPDNTSAWERNLLPCRSLAGRRVDVGGDTTDVDPELVVVFALSRAGVRVRPHGQPSDDLAAASVMNARTAVSMMASVRNPAEPEFDFDASPGG